MAKSLIKAILLLSVFFLVGVVRGQSSKFVGEWSFENIVQKNLSTGRNDGISDLSYKCPQRIEIGNESSTAFYLNNGEEFRALSIELEGDRITLSLFPGYLAHYRCERHDNLLILIPETYNSELTEDSCDCRYILN